MIEDSPDCVVEIAIRASGSWPPAKSFQFSQILRRTVYLFTFPCASWCTRYNGFTYRFLHPLPPPVIPGECTKLERGRSSTPKRSKLTPHFRKRIFCCAVPLLVVCVSLDSHTGIFGREHACARERGADRLRRRYSLAEQRL